MHCIALHCIALLSFITICVSTGLEIDNRVKDSNFKNAIVKSGVFKNDFNSLVHLPDVYDIMRTHVFENTSGKTPKLLFIGYDGVRADMLLTSGISTQFHLRLGNAKIPVTAPSWSAMFTGTWSHGIKSNEDAKSPALDTIFYDFHKKGVSTAFVYSWTNFHKYNYADEFKRAPQIFEHNETDDESVYDMMNYINTDTTAVFGVFDYADATGHKYGFNPSNAKYKYAFSKVEDATDKLLHTVKNRPSYGDEDWLVVIASDHGGAGKSHNNKRLRSTTTFVGMNKNL